MEEVLYMRGEVATGYGRGGKKLGVPPLPGLLRLVHLGRSTCHAISGRALSPPPLHPLKTSGADGGGRVGRRGEGGGGGGAEGGSPPAFTLNHFAHLRLAQLYLSSCEFRTTFVSQKVF